MKKLSLVALALALFNCAMYAQTGIKNIDSNLAGYTEKIKAGNYFEALLKLQNVRQATDSLVGLQLAQAFPKDVANWQITNSSDKRAPMGPNAGGSASNNGTINVTRFYKDKNEKTIPDSIVKMVQQVDPHAMHGPVGDGGVAKKMLFVAITNNMMELATFINSYSETGEATGPSLGPDVTIKSLRIKGYRCLLTINPSFNSYEMSIIVGSSIIKISGQSLEDNSVVDKIAEAIDYSKVKAILGE